MSKGDELVVVCSSRGRKACVSARGGKAGTPGSQLLPICEWVWVTAHIFLSLKQLGSAKDPTAWQPAPMGKLMFRLETVATSHRSWPRWAFHTYPNYVCLLLPCPSTTKPASSKSASRFRCLCLNGEQTPESNLQAEVGQKLKQNTRGWVSKREKEKSPWSIGTVD